MNPGLSGEAAEGGLSRKACRGLAGTDVGLSAAVAVLSWLVLHSWLRGEFWWAKLNVAGALFHGPKVYTMGLGRATLEGFALLLVVYTLLGVLFAWVARSEGFATNLMLASGWSAVWHVVSQRWFWPSLDMFGPSYFPELATLPAHLIMALCLARFAVRYRSLALTFGDPEWASELAVEPAGVVMQAQEPAAAEPVPEAGEDAPEAAAEAAEEERGSPAQAGPEPAETERQVPEAGRELPEAAPEAGEKEPDGAAKEAAGGGEGPDSGGAETLEAPTAGPVRDVRREAFGHEDERADC